MGSWVREDTNRCHYREKVISSLQYREKKHLRRCYLNQLKDMICRFYIVEQVERLFLPSISLDREGLNAFLTSTRAFHGVFWVAFQPLSDLGFMGSTEKFRVLNYTFHFI